MRLWASRSTETVFEAKPYLKVVREAVELPDGRRIDDFYQVQLRSFTSVVPIDDEGRITVLRHYKHGPRRITLSFPGGFLEPEEAPLRGAQRELAEETGVSGGRWTDLGTFTDNGNQRGCRGYYFLAQGCEVTGVPDDGDLEEMEVLQMTVAEVDAAMRDGAFAIVHDVANWGLARPYL